MVWRRFTAMQARGVGAAALVSLVGAGFSAQALVPDDVMRTLPAPPPTGYEAEDHFPGAAWFTAVDDSAPAAASGATGTAPPPDLPPPPAAAIDASVRPAAAFVAAGSATDRARALQCLTSAIYYEAATEPDAGQRAVAQVVLNRVRHPAFPATVCGVVYQGSERSGCQFSFACDGSMRRAPARAHWLRAEKVAEAALGGSVFAPVGLATHYHTHAVTPSWNRALVMTGVFGAHFFHRWKGGWGTPAAFSQRYRGGEPVPGPRRPVATDPVATPRPAPPAAAAPDTIRPRYAASGTARAAAAAPAAPEAPGLPESTILDKWRGTGQPLR